MEPIITVKSLIKKYQNKTVLDNISLSVKKGEIFGLLGPNGAGKTTTLECLLGMKKSDGGLVSIMGLDPHKSRKILFEKVGVQFQESFYSERIRVGELCEMHSCLYCEPQAYEPLLTQFSLADKKRDWVKNLSGGERQKLFVVLALIPNPSVLFLDELTTGLDAHAKRQVWSVLQALKQQGVTLFLTSHLMEEVAALCDRIAILHQGRFIFEGSVEEAISLSPYSTLEEAYLWFVGEEAVLNA